MCFASWGMIYFASAARLALGTCVGRCGLKRVVSTAGLAFAGVHDSFWTHAGSVPQMNAILREKFVELHRRPLLEELREELMAAHPGLDLAPVPPVGDLDLDGIRDAKYFFN